MLYHISPRSTTFALIYPQESTFYLISPHLPWVSHVLTKFTLIYPILSSCFLVDRHVREVNLVFLRLGPLNSSQSRLSLFTHALWVRHVFALSPSWQLIRVSILIDYDMINGFLFIKAKRVFDTVDRRKFCLRNKVLQVLRPPLSGSIGG